jgi:hypothetical protein
VLGVDDEHHPGRLIEQDNHAQIVASLGGGLKGMVDAVRTKVDLLGHKRQGCGRAAFYIYYLRIKSFISEKTQNHSQIKRHEMNHVSTAGDFDFLQFLLRLHRCTQQHNK